MTRQIKDEFHYRSESLLLVASNGSGLFDPEQYGIRMFSYNTGCRRGFYCTYEVEGRALLITEVHLNLVDKDKAAADQGKLLLFGKAPQRYTDEYGFGFPTIDDIREPIPFTGGLLIGDNAIYETDMFVANHPGCGRKTVYELVFDSGRLIEEHDRSAQMAEFRELLSSDSLISWLAAQRSLVPRPISRGEEEDPKSRALRTELTEIRERIKRCFSLEYEDWWP